MIFEFRINNLFIRAPKDLVILNIKNGSIKFLIFQITPSHLRHIHPVKKLYP